MKDGLQGIDAETWAVLEAMPCRTFGDAYSCTCRPGSWEWQTPEAMAMRLELERRGFVSSQDPDATWRVRWDRR